MTATDIASPGIAKPSFHGAFSTLSPARGEARLYGTVIVAVVCFKQGA